MDTIALAQDRDYCQALFNAVMNHKMLGIFYEAEHMFHWQERYGSMKLV
jgi:hypothetical protein